MPRPKLRPCTETAVRRGRRDLPGAIPSVILQNWAVEARLGGWSGGWGYNDGILRELPGCSVEQKAVDGVAVGVFGGRDARDEGEAVGWIHVDEVRGGSEVVDHADRGSLRTTVSSLEQLVGKLWWGFGVAYGGDSGGRDGEHAAVAGLGVARHEEVAAGLVRGYVTASASYNLFRGVLNQMC